MLVSLIVYSFMNFRNRKTQYGFKFFVDIVSYKCVFVTADTEVGYGE